MRPCSSAGMGTDATCQALLSAGALLQRHRSLHHAHTWAAERKVEVQQVVRRLLIQRRHAHLRHDAMVARKHLQHVK